MIDDATILKTVNDVEYVVLLTNGKVSIHLSTYPREGGPYKYCRNIQEADLCSLNILRQNVAEVVFKTGKTPKFMNRTFLEHTQSVETKKILPTMKWLEYTFPEKFV